MRSLACLIKIGVAMVASPFLLEGCVTTEPGRLHADLLVLDSHLDTPALLMRPGFDITERHDPGTDYSQVDLPRMDEGGLDGGFFVIYTPQGPLTDEGFARARNTAILRASAIQRMVAANPDRMAFATKAGEAAPVVNSGRKVVYQSIENSYPLGTDLSLLKLFFDFGVRMVGPVHFLNNQFADSSTDFKGAVAGGLTPLGEDLVREANRLGIVLDASHAHDETLDDMLDLSGAPIILSHSGPKAVYNHPRNVDDARLKRLAEKGGVVQINAFGSYLTKLEDPEGRAEAFGALRTEFAGADMSDPVTASSFLERRREIDASFPPAKADFETFMTHLLYALDLLGPDHVGIGADWDGGGGVTGMEDITDIEAITVRLLAEGYSEEDLEKIWSGNLLRVLEDATSYAENLKLKEAAR